MRIFGRTPGEYIRFAAGVLVFIVVVGVLRFGLFQAGASVGQVKWLSVTAAMVAGAVYFGVTVHTQGFGGYRQLLMVVLLQQVVAQTVIILFILLAATQHIENIYSRPEFGGSATAKPWVHIAGHVVGGVGVGSLVLWCLASIVLLVTKRLSRRPASIEAPPPAESEAAPAVE